MPAKVWSQPQQADHPNIEKRDVTIIATAGLQSIFNTIMMDSWTDPVSYAAMLLEDLQLVTYFADSSMVYDVPVWLRDTQDLTERIAEYSHTSYILLSIGIVIMLLTIFCLFALLAKGKRDVGTTRLQYISRLVSQIFPSQFMYNGNNIEISLQS